MPEAIGGWTWVGYMEEWGSNSRRKAWEDPHSNWNDPLLLLLLFSWPYSAVSLKAGTADTRHQFSIKTICVFETCFSATDWFHVFLECHSWSPGIIANVRLWWFFLKNSVYMNFCLFVVFWDANKYIWFRKQGCSDIPRPLCRKSWALLCVCSLTSSTSVVLTSVWMTASGTSEQRILNTDNAGSSP